MTEEYVHIAKITSTFGLKGFLKARYSGDILRELKSPISLYVKTQHKEIFESLKAVEIIHKSTNLSFICFEGIDSIEKAERLVGKNIYIHSKDIPELNQKDVYYSFQLIGLSPKYKDSIFHEYRVNTILENPAHPILFLSNSQKEILIPYVSQFIGDIDLENKTIEILNWTDWLED